MAEKKIFFTDEEFISSHEIVSVSPSQPKVSVENLLLNLFYKLNIL